MLKMLFTGLKGWIYLSKLSAIGWVTGVTIISLYDKSCLSASNYTQANDTAEKKVWAMSTLKSHCDKLHTTTKLLCGGWCLWNCHYRWNLLMYIRCTVKYTVTSCNLKVAFCTIRPMTQCTIRNDCIYKYQCKWICFLLRDIWQISLSREGISELKDLSFRSNV